MKIRIILTYCLLTNVYAQDFREQILSKKIVDVGDCELDRTKNAFVDIDRYQLKLSFEVRKYRLIKENITLKNYSKHLFKGSGVADIDQYVKKEVDEIVFHPMTGSSSSKKSCLEVKRWFERELEMQRSSSDCIDSVTSQDRDSGKANSLGHAIKKALPSKSTKQ
jgi:hypothetical protein